MNVYVVAFKGNRRGFYVDKNSLEINTGTYLVVDAERGEDYGKVERKASENEFAPEDEISRVLRLGIESDYDRLIFNRNKEEETFYECLKFIEKHRLKMKLVDVEYQFDCNKITFFFTAEKRVDFRELVKDLAATFRTRIELRQIGVRDEAKRRDGYGICGKRQCCSTWLSDFSTITTQMARRQNLALNPQKLSGNCGRLLCCLKYEMDFYEEVMPEYPAKGSRCATRHGKGRITKVDIFREEISILLDDAGEIKMSIGEVKRAIGRGKFTIQDSPSDRRAERTRGMEELEG
ncbi:MAG: regulatory iron-sulfur-containing complex subunit RicT [candidate division Zixibacteria bacterium]